MMEITFTEIVLFAWAALATASAFHHNERATMLHQVLRHLIENEDARNNIVAEFKRMEEKLNAKA